MKGIMHVETAPASPDVTAAYHEWYELHLREIAALDGVTAVRRYAPTGGDGRIIAIYELEGDDIMDVVARIRAASRDRTPMPDGVMQTDPPATVRYLELISEYDPSP